MKFLMETHCHTRETSWCAHVPAKIAVENYKKAGYDGVVITDHFYSEWFENAKGSWSVKLDKWLEGYNSAAEAGRALGICVYLGLEMRLNGSANDYLLYGADPRLLFQHPELMNFNIKQVYNFAEEHGLFFSQAHPFRPGMIPADPAFLHGVEAYNKNIRHNNQNELAVDFAEKHGLVKLSGSDYHQTEDLARGGLYLPWKPENSRALAAMLRGNEILELIID